MTGVVFRRITGSERGLYLGIRWGYWWAAGFIYKILCEAHKLQCI
jgi:hypothetical protein